MSQLLELSQIATDSYKLLQFPFAVGSFSFIVI